jgi:hypothetical protein
METYGGVCEGDVLVERDGQVTGGTSVLDAALTDLAKDLAINAVQAAPMHDKVRDTVVGQQTNLC